jgi:hypothetical protein
MNSTILAALIALVGTILTVYVGYRQWKHHQDTNYLPVFQNDRQVAYKILWGILPNPSTLSERKNTRDKTEHFVFNFFSEDELNEALDKIELHILKTIIYIEEEDGKLAIQYIKDLLKVRQIMTAMEALSKNKLEALRNEIFANVDPPPPSAGYEKKTSLVKVFYLNLVENLDDWRHECLLKSIDSPNSLWLLFTILLFSPRNADVVMMTRKIYASLKLARRTRKTLVIRYRNILSGKA